MDPGNQFESIEPSIAPAHGAMRFLHLTARLLLEYSARTETIKRQIERVARHLKVDVSTSFGYCAVTIYSGDKLCCHVEVSELRLNAAINVLTIRAIDDFCSDRIDLEGAIERLEKISQTEPEYGRWLLALLFGFGASALAWILRADWGAIAVSGIASGLGLVIRKELGKRHIIFFALPFAAALIGALFGGLAIRAGWTETYGLCLIVPALMLVPGPHLILSVQEMLENHVQAGIARLGLALIILVAAALGILVGVKLTLGAPGVLATPSAAMLLTLPLDIVLAGMAAAAFGAFYNTPWRVLWVAILCGMVGHGIRFLGMEQGMSQVVATFLGCLAIGGVASLTAERFRLPFATIAFAGAVSMMPGVFIYESFAGALWIAASGRGADPALVAASLALVVKAVFIVGAMAIGLLLGAWIGSWARLSSADSFP